VLWDVHDATKAVVIGLTDERYTHLVVGVDDPAQTVAAIRRALGTKGEGSEALASHKAVVEVYIDGFRRSDHEAILASLADDVVWVLHGYRTLRGKEAFDDEIENDAAVGSPTLHLDRLIEAGDTVVAVGHGEMTLKEAGRVAFVFAEVFTFTGDRISGWRPSTLTSAARAPVPVSGHRGIAAARGHRWPLASTTCRHGGAKLGGVKDLTVYLEGGLR
jgi:uncharacterized protein